MRSFYFRVSYAVSRPIYQRVTCLGGAVLWTVGEVVSNRDGVVGRLPSVPRGCGDMTVGPVSSGSWQEKCWERQFG